MNPDAKTIWQAPSWALAVLLACLGMLGPFSIDTYLPAFTSIAKVIGATREMRRLGLPGRIAVMNRSTARYGQHRRRPVCSRLVVFTRA